MRELSQQDNKAVPLNKASILLQRIFISSVTIFYLGQSGILIYRERGYSQAVYEALFITLVPIVFCAIAYLLRTRTIPRLTKIVQSFIVAIVTYMFWVLTISLAQLSFWHTIAARFSDYIITAAFSVLILLACLIYLKYLKIW